MKKSILLLLAAIALAGTVRRGFTQDSMPRTGAGEVGRYQMVASATDGRIYVLDTATGQVWSRASGSAWRDEGNPTQVKGRPSKRQPKPPAPTLELPEKAVEMTVLQREERAVPGSDGSVLIRLGDVTEGQVLLEVVTSNGDRLLERTSVGPKDTVQFVVGKTKYALQVVELQNILVGDDFATITVSEVADKRTSDKRRSPESGP